MIIVIVIIIVYIISHYHPVSPFIQNKFPMDACVGAAPPRSAPYWATPGPESSSTSASASSRSSRSSPRAPGRFFVCVFVFVICLLLFFLGRPDVYSAKGENTYSLFDGRSYIDNRSNSRANTWAKTRHLGRVVFINYKTNPGSAWSCGDSE